MALNFCLADVQNGMGPYLALFLQSFAKWDPSQIGVALAAGNIAQVIAQTPAGATIDIARPKRELIVLGCVFIAVACLLTVLWTQLPAVLTGQILIGTAGAIFPPCLAAITLGLVGRKRLDRQMGTNQAFNAAGNMAAALAIGGVGYYFGLKWMFYLVAALCVVASLLALSIRAKDIDFNLACGADDGEKTSQSRPKAQERVWNNLRGAVEALGELVRLRPLMIFLVSAVIFHFANAAMVPLVTELLAKNQGAKTAVVATSAYMLASQFVFTIVALFSGRLAGRLGRKPLFLFAFAALLLRGLLYTVSHHPVWLIAVQCMDGLGAGIFGVVSVLIIADLTQGTGRFNAAQGAIATAQGTGAFLSNVLAGYLAKHAGANVTFIALAGIALIGLVFFALCMPETLKRRTAAS